LDAAMTEAQVQEIRQLSSGELSESKLRHCITVVVQEQVWCGGRRSAVQQCGC
jgi:hypothetical protein